ncbi:hypothetical protein BDV24DRAFT_166950 [Aspergillus arachidicola]|uniref:Uncharacterized protein n=1 Tax=Aspergillus arachidicola TaxID=656916 RepID=A0A5N6Y062_9EURO|nr:hypothetical protein BDV24DRAFT_166950 [Aspergillus arachidicola]
MTRECHDNKRQALVQAAGRRQSEAIKMFTKVGVNIEPPEHKVSFALSSLLIVFAFGLPPATASQHQTKANPLDELVRIFKLSRKMIKFATPTMNEGHTSKIGGLLLLEEVRSSLSSSSRVVISALRELLNTVYSPTHKHHQAFARYCCLSRKVICGPRRYREHCFKGLHVDLRRAGDIQ